MINQTGEERELGWGGVQSDALGLRLARDELLPEGAVLLDDLKSVLLQRSE